MPTIFFFSLAFISTKYSQFILCIWIFFNDTFNSQLLTNIFILDVAHEKSCKRNKPTHFVAFSLVSSILVISLYLYALFITGIMQNTCWIACVINSVWNEEDLCCVAMLSRSQVRSLQLVLCWIFVLSRIFSDTVLTLQTVTRTRRQD